MSILVWCVVMLTIKNAALLKIGPPCIIISEVLQPLPNVVFYVKKRRLVDRASLRLSLYSAHMLVLYCILVTTF